VVADGISVEQVASDVFDAIENERFYILTHPDSLAAVKVRAEDIIQNRLPTTIRF
jgi:hypothetical protein